MLSFAGNPKNTPGSRQVFVCDGSGNHFLAFAFAGAFLATAFFAGAFFAAALAGFAGAGAAAAAGITGVIIPVAIRASSFSNMRFRLAGPGLPAPSCVRHRSLQNI
jgi:hypothetical protein